MYARLETISVSGSGMRMMKSSGKNTAGLPVITSYSIHYTKLYDYLIETNAFWRDDALNGRTTYNNNPIFDSDNYFMPRFDSDEYGDWFSVWYTARTGDNYNLVNVDFNGRAVKDTMLYVAATVAFIVIILITMALLIARRVSRTVTRPITELTKGAAEVSDGNYDYEVPVFNKDEIGLFTEQFNKMTKGQKERLNLMETLEKFLSIV